MTYAQYRKKNNLIVSISEKPIKIDKKIMGQIKITKTQEKSILNQNNNAFVKNGKIEIKKKPEIIKYEKKLQVIDKIKKGQYTNQELGELLQELL